MSSPKPRRSLETPELCPVCGDAVPPKALACPTCGADHETGWRPGASASSGLDLPDDDFDYSEFAEREFGTSPKPEGVSLLWWVTAIFLLSLAAGALIMTALHR